MTEVTYRPKLTKAQKEFFQDYTKNAIQNLLIAQALPEFREAVTDATHEVISGIDLTLISEQVGQEFLSHIEFKTLVKVDKFLKSAEYSEAMDVAGKVLGALSEVFGAKLHEVAQGVTDLVDSAGTTSEGE